MPVQQHAAGSWQCVASIPQLAASRPTVGLLEPTCWWHWGTGDAHCLHYHLRHPGCMAPHAPRPQRPSNLRGPNLGHGGRLYVPY